jgi:acetolactate synthase-1/2/3 large subunit
MRVADYIMDRLVQLNIKQVFFLPGGGAMHLNDALACQPKLEPVVCLHEQACGIAAESAGKFLAGPSACLVTSGPGATNVLTATLGAWLDSTPVFFISGQVKRSDLKKGTQLRMLGVQEVDIVTLVQSITKMAVTLTDPQQVGVVMDELEKAALSGRRGPVWLDVPLDVQAMEIDPNTLPRARQESTPESEVITSELKIDAIQIIDKLRDAQRPVLLVGSGVRIAKAENALLSFAESAGIPVLTSWLGMDLIADDHPLYAGRPGAIAPRWANFALQNSDCLIVIGCRLDMGLTAYAHEKFARGAVKIMVDIDPAEIKKMRMEITIPVVADAGHFLQALIQTLAQEKPLPTYATWLDRIREWKLAYPLIQPNHCQSEEGLSLYYFTDVLSDALAPDDIIATGSAGLCVELFLLALRLKAGQRCFHNRGTGSMGFGLPAAIGACLAAGRKRTICVEGDGGLQMNVQELATLAAKSLPVFCFVINNGGYASIRTSQQNYFKRQIGADAHSGLKLPNLQTLCEAYGVAYQKIDASSSVSEQIQAVLSHSGPLIIEVFVLNEEPRIPRVATRQLSNGSMESSPLEDLYPFLDRDELRANMLIPTID